MENSVPRYVYISPSIPPQLVAGLQAANSFCSITPFAVQNVSSGTPFVPIQPRVPCSVSQSSVGANLPKKRSPTRKLLFTAEKSFKCGSCDQFFKRASNLKRHIGKLHPAIAELSPSPLKKQLETLNSESAQLTVEILKSTKRRDKLIARKRSLSLERAFNDPSSPGKFFREVGKEANRARKPYDQLGEKARNRRCKTIFALASKVSKGPKRTTERLLQDTVKKYCKTGFAQSAASDKRVVNLVSKQLVKKARAQMNTPSNYLRSLRFIFGKSSLGKTSTRSYGQYVVATNDATKSSGLPSMQLASYAKVFHWVRQQPEIVHLISQLKPAANLAKNGQNLGKADGRYRSLEPVLITAAEHMIKADFDKKNSFSLVTYSEKYNFSVAIGGDGYPDGKFTSTSITATILEMGSMVHSPDSVHLLFAGEFPEDDPVVLNYCRSLATEADVVSNKSFEMALEDGNIIVYRFSFVGLVGDQCFQKTALGQFSNGFTFPRCYWYLLIGHISDFLSSYANVRLSELSLIGQKVGLSEKWQEWPFDRLIVWGNEQQVRLQSAIAKGKVFQTKKAESDFLGKEAKEKEHRQKCEPPIGKTIGSNPYVCTLHVGLLAVGNILHDFYYDFLVQLLASMHGFGFYAKLRQNAANPSFTCLSIQPRKPNLPVHPIVLFVDVLSAMGLNRVASAYADLWDGKPGRGEARLTGQESRLFLHRFPQLMGKFVHYALNVQRLRSKDKAVASAMARTMQQLAYYHYCCLLLRKILTLANSTHSTDAGLEHLEFFCRRFHTIKALAASASGARLCHNNDWTIGHILPLHARKLAKNFPGAGLGCLSSQGREHMHMKSKAYKKKTHWRNRWELVFQYTHIASFFLPGKFKSYGSYYRKTKGIWASYTPPVAKEIETTDMRCMEPGCLFCSGQTSLPNKFHSQMHAATTVSELKWLK